jgi:hypothetical protein
MHFRTKYFLLTALLATAALGRAQGGPPFLTDDPGTPGNKQWEINVGWLGTHTPLPSPLQSSSSGYQQGVSAYQLPDLDINYGLGDRIQLKYELPLAVSTDGTNTTSAGVGQSLPGIKWRFLEHHTPGEPKSDENLTFAMSVYPMVSFNNSRSASERGIVPGGPSYWLPIEIAGKFGWLDYDAEVGHWWGNHAVPERWGRGLILGHEFNSRFELYAEVYDLQDANRIGGIPKQRQFTGDIGGRQTLDKAGHWRLLFMGGRALQKVTPSDGEPNWMGYIGVQMLFGPKQPEAPPTDKEQ